MCADSNRDRNKSEKVRGGGKASEKLKEDATHYERDPRVLSLIEKKLPLLVKNSDPP